MNDNIFGEVTYDVMWVTNIKFTLFGQKYEIKIGIDLKWLRKYFNIL